MFGAKGTGDTSGYGGLVRPVQLPGATPRPYGGWFDAAADQLGRLLPAYGQAVERVVVDRDEVTFHVVREHLLDVMRGLRDDPALRFEMCMGVSGVHYPHETGRELHAVYPLISVTHNRRVRVEVTCPDADPHIPSVVSVYPSTTGTSARPSTSSASLRRPPRPDPHRDARRLAGSSAAQGLPAGRHPGGVQGRPIPPPDERRAYK